ncbi:hypothetical protein FSP39_005295 [Pinctada imbricata]|uniref:Uncharacterized protein n=1 Tax=Pinctada imbricata TaxID=66713 RepID=A0AA88YQG8_PINIB|nr:hypothetical protein FSP39_005295 [Pinctada imbricata]
MRTRDVIQKLGSESYMHGISKIMASNSFNRRLFWTILLLCGVIAAVTQLSILSLKYLKFDTFFITTEIENSEVKFPSITVCPNDVPFKYPSEVLEDTENQLYKDWLSFLLKLEYPSTEYDHFRSWTGYFENLPGILPLFATECRDMILQCTYRGESCSCEHFDEYINAENVLKCYTFNASRFMSTPSMKYAKSGPDLGLSLILGVDDTKFEDKFNIVEDNSRPYDLDDLYGYSSGFTVQIHPPDTIPTPMTHGFDISTSQSTTVALKEHLGDYLPHPYTNCSFDVLRSDKIYRRTLFTCDLICKQKNIIKNCGCTSSILPVIDTYQTCGRLKNWNSDPNITDIIQNLLCEKRNILNYTPCHCSPCKENTYDITLSASDWPKYGHVFKLLEGLQEYLNENLRIEYDKLRDEMSDTQNFEKINSYIRKAKLDLARLNVYFKELNVVSTMQIPSYQFANLMADIGGSLGLWIGISALSMMELLELLTLIMCAFRKKKKNYNASKQDD